MLSYEQLKMFCSEDVDDPRQYLREPFSYKGRAYATNGHILVRGFSDREYSEAQTKTDTYTNKQTNFAESCDELIAGSPAKNLQKIPEWDRSVSDFEECRYCHGSMVYECGECGHEAECTQCDSGKRRARNPVKLGVSNVDSFYLRKIEALPNVLISLPDSPTAAVAFVFDGGEGLVMPMRV